LEIAKLTFPSLYTFLATVLHSDATTLILALQESRLVLCSFFSNCPDTFDVLQFLLTNFGGNSTLSPLAIPLIASRGSAPRCSNSEILDHTLS
jgi:hypothetical protein